MVVSILSDGVGKPFSARPAADGDLIILKIFETNSSFHVKYCNTRKVLFLFLLQGVL